MKNFGTMLVSGGQSRGQAGRQSAPTHLFSRVIELPPNTFLCYHYMPTLIFYYVLSVSLVFATREKI